MAMVTLVGSENQQLLQDSGAGAGTEEISKAQLKSRMLAIFRRLERESKELIVTDHGRPALRIIPIRKKIPVETVFARERRAIAEGKMPCISDEVLLSPLEAEDYEINTNWGFAPVPQPKGKRRNQ